MEDTSTDSTLHHHPGESSILFGILSFIIGPSLHEVEWKLLDYCTWSIAVSLAVLIVATYLTWYLFFRPFNLFRVSEHSIFTSVFLFVKKYIMHTKSF